MMGHSMGSFALRNYLQDYPVTVQGVIFMGTGTSPLPLTAALPFIKKMAEKQPKKPAPFIDKLAFGSFSKKFPEASSFNWLSKNQANVADYENDPLMASYLPIMVLLPFFRLLNEPIKGIGTKRSQKNCLF